MLLCSRSVTYDVLARAIYGKFTGEFKSNVYQKSLNQINCNSLNQMINMESFRCLRCLT